MTKSHWGYFLKAHVLVMAAVLIMFVRAASADVISVVLDSGLYLGGDEDNTTQVLPREPGALDDPHDLAIYTQAAQQGDTAFQNGLGDIYAKGQCVLQDYVQAAYWFKKAAEQGNPDAEFNLARLYAHGRGVKQDIALALAWYLKAADQGMPAAQNNAALLYESSSAIPHNFSEAARLFKLATNGEDSYAIGSLGVLYFLGKGVAKNFVVAYALLSLSGAGDAAYQHDKQLLLAQLSPEQLRQATTLAQAWKPTTPLPGVDDINGPISRSADNIRDTMDKNGVRFMAASKKWQQLNSGGQQGNIVLAFTIAPDGHVLYDYISRSDLHDAEVEAKFADILRKINFGAAAGGNYTGTFMICVLPLQY